MIFPAICNVPAAPLRKEPSHRTEMTSQLLFGEVMEVWEEKDEWYRIRNNADGYEGWLTQHLIEAVNPSYLLQPTQYVATEFLNPVRNDEQLMYVPLGSSLMGFDEERKTLWKENLKYEGQWRETRQIGDANMVEQFARLWLHAPYLWGGKTILGVDCSGLVQTVFKLCGVALLRDAYQQANQGEEVLRLADSKKGDVAFFHNEAGKVTHVGIVLDEKKIIHASGKVRIDRLDEEGIVHLQNGLQTHHLHSIRRFI